MKMSRNRRRLSLGVAAFCLGATACTTPQPVYDKQGRYIGYTRKFDEGKALSHFGAINGGLLGLFMEAVGNKVSEDNRREIEHDYRERVQEQIDNVGTGSSHSHDRAVQPGRVGPRVLPIVRRDVNYHNDGQLSESYFACQDWVDSNLDGRVGYEEFVGLKDRFRADEPITFFSRVFNRDGRTVSFRVLHEGKDSFPVISIPVKDRDYVITRRFDPGELKKPGIYEGVWEIDGLEIGYTRIEVVDNNAKRE